ncbi:hypothetical protein LXA43DRAFT_1050731 [Ganoderma leucocontextum]|nr:hypothetical protein LXA43DRAFT_1050731 [Ganoderma leucocontextum]
MSKNFSFLRRHPRNSAVVSCFKFANSFASGDKNSSSSTSTPSALSDQGSDSSEDVNGTMSGNNSKGDSAPPPDNILNGQYARARRELLELVRDLRALGHDKDLDIPQIAVIGKQSGASRRSSVQT